MRLYAAIVACVLMIAPALAEGPDDAAADMIACSAVRGDKARLECFEKALPALRKAFPEANAMAEAQREDMRAAAKEAEKQSFGLSNAVAAAGAPFKEEDFGAENLPQPAENADGEPDEAVNSITSGVVEIGRTLRGKMIVVLENGQVWRQPDYDRSTPYIPKNAEGRTATVKKGSLGSYVMKISDTHDAFKVRRVK